MGITAFFRDVLGANVKNERWSWGAIDPVSNRVFLRIWRDQLQHIDGMDCALVVRDTWRRSSGYGERLQHIQAIRDGAEGFGVVCAARDTKTAGSRRIGSFDKDSLVRFGEVIERAEGVFAEVLGETSTAELLRSPSGFSTLGPDLASIVKKTRVDSTTKQALVDARVGQGQFRARVLALWSHRCAVTGSELAEVIRASHIRPWRHSTDEQRLDPNNGLPLVANLDALFDAGLITFGRDGALITSRGLPPGELERLGVSREQLARTPSEETEQYLRFHREEVFRG